MTFSNAQLHPAELPALADIQLQPVADGYARYRLLHALLVWIPALILLSLLPTQGPWPGLLPLIGVWGLVGLGPLYSALTWLEARRRAYALREHDLIYRSGLFVQRTRILPVARIQHVETVSGPLERLFGLVRLNCFTAGGSSGDLLLAGLDAATAAQVRDYLLQRVEPGPAPDHIPPDD